ncbi:MAG TPA: DUF3857 domain-containing protein [Alphaproteobacteria bacterium]|nr:DUF3857 domain-containing protein [Alphaproteobacteria bacterium]
MRWIRCICLAFSLSSISLSTPADGPWLPVSPEDLQMKEFKQLPGAEAVLLYYANEIDDVNHAEFFYSRIKIFTESGKRYGDVEITMLPEASVVELAARTIHPDGTIVEFTDQPFEKVVVKAKGLRIRVQAFTLAQVTAGSIIEYRYTLRYRDQDLGYHRWTVQHDLFTVKEHLHFIYARNYSIRWLPTPGLEKTPEFDQKTHSFNMDVANVSAFQPEEQMPPEEDYRLEVKFFYTNPFMNSPAAFWNATGWAWSHAVDEYIGNHKEVREAALEAIGSETDPGKKLRKLYDRAQEVRNLSYERARTEDEQKKENLKGSKNVSDVLKHGHGDRNEITRLFVALAKGAGFTASVVFVSSRESRLFDREVLSFGQLDSEIALVRLNGKLIYLDPGTRFCPYGLIRWMRSGTAAMDMHAPGQIVSTPGTTENDAGISRSTDLKLSADGVLKGMLRVEFSGVEALERRLSALDTDEAGRKKNMEEEVKQWLPANVKVQMTDSVGWEKEYEPLVAVFDIEVPEYASAAGKRLLAPTCLFQPKQKRVFKGGPRKYPVYFQYAFSERDFLAVEMPDGYSVENLAPEQTAKVSFATYKSSSSASGKRFHAERELLFNGVFFPPSRYEELRGFFSKVQAGDDLQVVLRQGAIAEAEKPK